MEKFQFNKPIVIIKSNEALLNCFEILSLCKEIGIDTEAAEDKLALVQLATSDYVYLIQTKFIDFELLKTFLKKDRPKKIGFSLGNDIKYLGFSFKYTDLQYLDDCRPSLSELCEMHLGLSIRDIKTKSMSRSNWSRYNLTPKQQLYAAVDAYLPLLIFQNEQKVKNESKQRKI